MTLVYGYRRPVALYLYNEHLACPLPCAGIASRLGDGAGEEEVSAVRRPDLMRLSVLIEVDQYREQVGGGVELHDFHGCTGAGVYYLPLKGVPVGVGRYQGDH